MANFDLSPTLSAASIHRKPQMSITLPRNFAPLGLDGCCDPKTPDQTFAEIKLPPPPHHSTLRIRRPRINMDNFQARNNALPATLFASDIPVPSSALKNSFNSSPTSDQVASDFVLPSVEITGPLPRPLFQHSLTDPIPSERLRLPSYREQVPRTPPAQTKLVLSESRPSIWDMQRSASECSYRSDSSLSSCGTFTTRPTSFDGSATSPDLDSQDPFCAQKVNIIPDTPTRRSKKLRVSSMLSKDKVQWSIEMDNHLFNVYQMYLADPAVTPFKTMPGSIPPTGVCHRVARTAKETWPKASRISRPIVRKYRLRNVLEERNIIREKTPEPNDFLKTSSNRDTRGSWPSESATRKRLKQLCKEKYTISAHYQRLRQSRSPSPFSDQFLRKPPARLTRSMSTQLSDDQPCTSYATRELGISLVASGATAPLAQLVTGESPSFQQRSDEWFNTPLEPSPDKMNISPPSGLGINTKPARLEVGSSIPRLASPFTYSTWNGPTHPNQQHRRQISQNQFDTVHATGSRLLSPFKVEPDVSSNVHKRRAQHNLEDELSPQGGHLNDSNAMDIQNEPLFKTSARSSQELIFTGIGDLSQRRIRLRNRGATLGAATNREQIERLFTPIEKLSDADDVPPVPSIPPSLMGLFKPGSTTGNSLAPPEVDANQKRLGSPFELDPNKRSHRIKSPRHVPSLSDPFIQTSTFSNPLSQQNNNVAMSIGERLAAFSQLHQHPSAQTQQGDEDPFA